MGEGGGDGTVAGKREGGGATGSTRSGLRVATSEGTKGRTLRAARFRRGRSLERRACGRPLTTGSQRDELMSDIGCPHVHINLLVHHL